MINEAVLVKDLKILVLKTKILNSNAYVMKELKE